jgi:hypothetical protein
VPYAQSSPTDQVSQPPVAQSKPEPKDDTSVEEGNKVQLAVTKTPEPHSSAGSPTGRDFFTVGSTKTRCSRCRERRPSSSTRPSPTDCPMSFSRMEESFRGTNMRRVPSKPSEHTRTSMTICMRLSRPDDVCKACFDVDYLATVERAKVSNEFPRYEYGRAAQILGVTLGQP